MFKGINANIFGMSCVHYIDVYKRQGYAYFRIPTMVITNSGTILAFAEGRRNGPEDEGDIDICLLYTSRCV